VFIPDTGYHRTVGNRRFVIVTLASAACIAAAGVAALAVNSAGHKADTASANVAIVWGNPIPRSLFIRGISARIAVIKTQTGAAPRRGTAAYRRLQDDTMRQLVSDVTVVAEARKLGLVTIHPPVVSYVVRNPANVQRIWNRVYAFAARSVPDPDDPKVVRATRFDEHELPELLTPHQLKVYSDWQARRDRVASAFFGGLFQQYQPHIWYAPGFRPPET